MSVTSAWEKYCPGLCVAVPPLASEFDQIAAAWRLSLDELVRKLLFEAPLPEIPLQVGPGVTQAYTWVGGHELENPYFQHRGPRKRFRGMIIGKCLGRAETTKQAQMMGSTGQHLREAMRMATGVAGEYDPSEVYVTNLLKTQPLQPGKFAKSWIKTQAPFLTLELLLALPDYVLLLGNEVIKHFLGNSATLKDTEGRWFDWELDLRLSEEEEKIPGENIKVIKLMPCLNPAALEYEQKVEDKARLVDGCRLFVQALNGATGLEPPKLPDYPVVSDIHSLRSFMEQMADDSVLKLIGTDAEWQGEHPQNRDAFLRCMQMGWREGHAIVVELTDERGQPAFRGRDGRASEAARAQAFDLIYEFFKKAKLRVAGFFFQADHEWLSYFGLDLMEFFEAAETPERMRTEGGFGLDLAANAVDELSRIDLDSMRWRYTKIQAYKYVLHEARKKIISAAKKLDEELSDYLELGFGWMSGRELYPYAGADADVTHTATVNIMEHLDSDRFGRNCWLPFWHSQRAAPVACEIMQVGMPFDSERCWELAVAYERGMQRVLGQTRKRLNWPGWNPRSPYQVSEALYGARYSPKRDKATGERLSVRPMGARTFNLEPVLNNDPKSPRLWSEIREDGKEHLNQPGTNAKNIGMIVKDPEGVAARRFDNALGSWTVQRFPEIEGVETIRELRALHQVQANFVGIPRRRPEGGWYLEGGYNSVCCDDGFVRCLISMVKETGRWSASGPNLHALPKKTEPFYKRVLKDLYRAKIRSMFKAPPGWVIIESDYSSAEMFMLAIASGDRTLWEHCQRGLLPEDDPQFVDIHSTVSVTGLQLRCAPTKAGLDSIGMAHIRDVTKCVAEGELIAMSNGWVRVEQVHAQLSGGAQTAAVPSGRVFVQSDRFATPLLAVHASGEKECFSVQSELGFEVISSAEHRHYVLRASGAIDFVETRHLLPSDYLLLMPGLADTDSKLSIPKEFMELFGLMAEAKGLEAFAPEDECRLLGVLAGMQYRRSWMTDMGKFVQLNLGSGVTPRHSRVASLCGLLNKFLERPGSLQVLRGSPSDTLVEVRDGAMTELVRLAGTLQWSGVPERVLRWPAKFREQFLAGLVGMLTVGSSRSPSLIACPELARRIQQLALASGVLLAREEASFDSRAGRDRQILRPVDRTSRELWENVASRLQWQASAWTTVSDRKIPHVARYLSELIGWSPLEESSRVYATRRETLELDSAARRRREQLSPRQREQVSRIHDFLASQLLADKIAAIRSVGKRQTYDFETSSERRHLVFYGGIASHNSVVYGWAYGRGAKAIVIGVREQGIIIDLGQAEAIVETLTTLYPDAAGFLEASSERVQHGFLVTPLGRVRRAPDSQDQKKLAGYEREFKNAPIQGGVADVVNIAAYNLRQIIKRERRLRSHIALQMHDAFYFLTPYDEVEVMCNEVIPEGMVHRVPIVPYRLDGSRRTDLEPAYMGCGMNVYFRWGEKPDRELLMDVGIDTKKIKRLE